MNLDSSIFNIDLPSPRPEVGKLLVAEPFMHGDIFAHAVILLIDCEEGKPSMGLMMNRGTGYKLGELTDVINKSFEVPLFCGGPVDNERLFYMHTLGDIIPDSRKITDDLYIGGRFDSLKEYIEDGYPTDGYVRFFAGYSGWDPHQLDEEMKARTWTVASPLSGSQMLKGEGDSYWHRIVRALGPAFKGWQYHPLYPSAN